MPSEPKVIVLVLSYNGKHLLKDCLSSYTKNTYNNFEILVIDNGSKDGTEDYVSKNFPEVKLLRLKNNQGYSGGFNRGIDFAIRKLRADHVLISNNDVEVDNMVITELVNAIQSKKDIGFATGKVYFHNFNGSKNVLQTVGKKCDDINLVGEHIGFGEEDTGQHNQVKVRCLTDDVFMLVSKDLIEKVGIYYEEFFHESEQADWQFRGISQGFSIIYTPHAKIWHKVSSTVGSWDNSRITFYRYRSSVLLIRRNTSDNHFIFYAIIRFFKHIPETFISFILKKRFDLIVPMISGFISGFKWVVQNPSKGL